MALVTTPATLVASVVGTATETCTDVERALAATEVAAAAAEVAAAAAEFAAATMATVELGKVTESEVVAGTASALIPAFMVDVDDTDDVVEVVDAIFELCVLLILVLVLLVTAEVDFMPVEEDATGLAIEVGNPAVPVETVTCDAVSPPYMT